MRRVNVVGSSSSGKTTLAKALAQRLSLPYVELDVLYRDGIGREPISEDLFTARVRGAVGEKEWIIDGDRMPVRDLIWRHADTVIWLDYPLATVLVRYLVRTFRRRKSPPQFWPETGPPEVWGRILRKDSLFRVIISTHRIRRRELTALTHSHQHLTIVRLGWPSQGDRWMRRHRKAEDVVGDDL